MKTITVQGVVFQVKTETDDDAGRPWDSECGHGPVREKFYPDLKKLPGERVLDGSARVHSLLYDFAEAVKIARRESWGLNDGDAAKLAERLGRTPTHREVCAESARLDFERLRAWCNNEWAYIGVTVTAPNGETESLWGIESDSGDYLETVARELAEELAPRVIEEQAREAAHAAMPARLALPLAALLQQVRYMGAPEDHADVKAAADALGGYFDMLARIAAQRDLTDLEAQALAAIKGAA